VPGVWLVSLQVINWLCTAAEDQLRRHVTVADNLRAASAQLADFSEFRATAEVSQSSQRANSTNCSQSTWRRVTNNASCNWADSISSGRRRAHSSKPAAAACDGRMGQTDGRQ